MWRYESVAARPGAPTSRLIVSADAINANDQLPVVLAVHVVDTDPESRLAVRVGDHGWARALSIGARHAPPPGRTDRDGRRPRDGRRQQRAAHRARPLTPSPCITGAYQVATSTAR